MNSSDNHPIAGIIYPSDILSLLTIDVMDSIYPNSEHSSTVDAIFNSGELIVVI